MGFKESDFSIKETDLSLSKLATSHVSLGGNRLSFNEENRINTVTLHVFIPDADASKESVSL